MNPPLSSRPREGDRSFFRDTSPGYLMNIADLLAPDAVLLGLKPQSKKQLLQELASRAHGLTRLSERRIFETLVERERLGTTGVGAGIAIPHGRMTEAKTITGIFARLENSIDYEAVDSQPVDLVFMLLAPENAGADHLKALARVSRLLRDKATCDKLRATKSPEAIYAILTAEKNGAASSAA
jgi:PTS system nitrogen regulatory IIA component